MNSHLLYFLQSGLCLLAFWIIYRIFLQGETHYRMNRIYLISTLLFSTLIPLLEISLPGTGAAGLVPIQMEPLTILAGGSPLAGEGGLNYRGFASLVYFAVMLILAFRLLWMLGHIGALYRTGRVVPGIGYRMVLHTREHPPFSFLRTVFISQRQYSEGLAGDITEHEAAHVRQWHSIDALLAEILLLLQWFNPLAWIYRDLIRQNHEFLADEAVINRGFSPEEYRLRIFAQLFGIRAMPAVQPFSHSLTKNRLKMIEKSRSSGSSRLKMFLALPAAMLLFYVFACSSNRAELSAQDPGSGEKSEVFTVVDEAAEPEGGMLSFRKYIAEHIRYPEEAAKKGVQGRVYIQFIVDEKGKIVKAVQSADIPPPPPPPVEGKEGEDVPPPPPPPEKVDIKGVVVVGFRPPEGLETDYWKGDVQLLVNEAIRVITEADIQFTPAKKDGRPVKSAWTIPIAFKLE